MFRMKINKGYIKIILIYRRNKNFVKKLASFFTISRLFYYSICDVCQLFEVKSTSAEHILYTCFPLKKLPQMAAGEKGTESTL